MILTKNLSIQWSNHDGEVALRRQLPTGFGGGRLGGRGDLYGEPLARQRHWSPDLGGDRLHGRGSCVGRRQSELRLQRVEHFWKVSHKSA